MDAANTKNRMSETKPFGRHDKTPDNDGPSNRNHLFTFLMWYSPSGIRPEGIPRYTGGTNRRRNRIRRSIRHNI